ncbi:MAG: hypothetical protein AB1758_18675 [Candidatus Eremiobacterota bacterium]
MTPATGADETRARLTAAELDLRFQQLQWQLCLRRLAACFLTRVAASTLRPREEEEDPV